MKIRTWCLETISFELIALLQIRQKIRSFHFLPSAVYIVESFLIGRLQQVSVNCILSERIELKQGIPRGTVIRPLFFKLYVNDLPELTSKTAHISQYADDCLV